MSPPDPGMSTAIVAVTFLLFSSTRVTVPSPWFNVQTEPPPVVRNRGFDPTGIDSRASPLAASTAVRTLFSTPVIQTMPPLNNGLEEPGEMEVLRRTLLLDGSIRTNVPFLSVISQMLSSLVVIPPSAPAGGIGSIATILFLAASTRTRRGFFPHIGTHILPNPDASREPASPGTFT